MGNDKKTTATPELKTEEIVPAKNEVITKPKICCLDLTEDVTTALLSSGYNLFLGTLGAVREIPNTSRGDSQLVTLDYDFPENFHEFDMLILDLTNEVKKEFKPVVPGERKTSSRSMFYLACSYPSTLFDPRPLSSSLLAQKITEVQNRKFIEIIFAAEQYDIEYEIVEISDGYSKNHPNEKKALYSFNPWLPLSSKRVGKEVTICSIPDELLNLLKKHVADLRYEQTFSHPTEWDKEKGQSVFIPSLVPFLKNVNDEIVSFVQQRGNYISFVFPNIKNKEKFLSDFLKNILPGLYPEMFPFSTQFKWIENPEYFVPNHAKLLEEKIKLQEEFNKRSHLINEQVNENSSKFKFLHDLLTETDDKLVHAVRSFLKFLEFKKVIIKDEESKSIKEEDLQVELDEGILVVETKGIGGTSTDADCSQISKIKHRRSKERNKFDVSALYIVNHQRFLPPSQRRNPPFTEHQIEDAKNDERGLLTTWQLFNLYYEIQNGVITKEQARKQILEYGLVIFKPKLSVNLGSPNELFQNGQVAIINIANTKIKVGDTIILERDNYFSKAKVLSLQIGDNEVKEASNGELGIKLDHKMAKKTVLWTE
ncbi:MAG: hypothetical protein JWO06_2597 [Bacteroidota bacterium]|nr:hypothetical protein [Bacteroidota bacterium]